jgi:hypothetical protein
MITFKRYFREATRDSEGQEVLDHGLKGKEFEDKLIRAFKMTGLDMKVNRASGALWDVHPVGPGWTKLVSDRDVNIKLNRTLWMFSSTELNTMLPWPADEFDKDTFDNEAAAAKVKQFLQKRGLGKVVWLKAKSKDIENQIIQALSDQDVNKLDSLLVKKNFNHERLGNKYSVRVLDNGKRVSSIAIDFGGTVFMRSEKPRKINGTMTVTFRTPKKKKISKTDRKLKQAKGLPE